MLCPKCFYTSIIFGSDFLLPSYICIWIYVNLLGPQMIQMMPCLPSSLECLRFWPSRTFCPSQTCLLMLPAKNSRVVKSCDDGICNPTSDFCSARVIERIYRSLQGQKFTTKKTTMIMQKRMKTSYFTQFFPAFLMCFSSPKVVLHRKANRLRLWAVKKSRLGGMTISRPWKLPPPWKT